MGARAGRRVVVVGITDYAQEQLGDVVFVGLPEAGSEVQAGQPMGEVESTKSVSDVYSPVSGKVVESNAEVESTPELINSDPYGEGLAGGHRGAEGRDLDGPDVRGRVQEAWSRARSGRPVANPKAFL